MGDVGIDLGVKETEDTVEMGSDDGVAHLTVLDGDVHGPKHPVGLSTRVHRWRTWMATAVVDHMSSCGRG
jgi:hypothetical protein